MAITMDLEAACPHCEGQITYPEEYSGIQIGCPHCEQALLLPPRRPPPARPPRPQTGGKQPAPATHSRPSPQASTTPKNSATKKPSHKLAVLLSTGITLAIAFIAVYLARTYKSLDAVMLVRKGDRVCEARNNKPFTGFARSRHLNGELHFKAYYKDGKEHGLYRLWRTNGIPLYQATYRIGVYSGKVEWYGPTGDVMHSAEFKNGKEIAIRKNEPFEVPFDLIPSIRTVN